MVSAVCNTLYLRFKIDLHCGSLFFLFLLFFQTENYFYRFNWGLSDIYSLLFAIHFPQLWINSLLLITIHLPKHKDVSDATRSTCWPGLRRKGLNGLPMQFRSMVSGYEAPTKYSLPTCAAWRCSLSICTSRLWLIFRVSFFLTFVLLVANFANTKWCVNPKKITETLAHGYSYESTQRERSNEYRLDRV